jgi:hypothetical protein
MGLNTLTEVRCLICDEEFLLHIADVLESPMNPVECPRCHSADCVARWAEGFPVVCGPMSLRGAAVDCLKWHEAYWRHIASRGPSTDEQKPT